MARVVVNFIRSNILVVLAIPVVLAGTVGLYSRTIRDRQPSANPKVVDSSDKDLLKD